MTVNRLTSWCLIPLTAKTWMKVPHIHPCLETQFMYFPSVTAWFRFMVYFIINSTRALQGQK